jgi:hypothetical protein
MTIIARIARRSGRVSVAAVAVALAFSACGGGSGDTDGAPNASGGVPEPVELPDVTVRDVTAGTDVQLTSLIPASQPTLLWFWAPH